MAFCGKIPISMINNLAYHVINIEITILRYKCEKIQGRAHEKSKKRKKNLHPIGFI